MRAHKLIPTETRRLPRRLDQAPRILSAVTITLTVLLAACAESKPPTEGFGLDADDTGAGDVAFDIAPADARDQGGDATAPGDTGGLGDTAGDSHRHFLVQQ